MDSFNFCKGKFVLSIQLCLRLLLSVWSSGWLNITFASLGCYTHTRLHYLCHYRYKDVLCVVSTLWGEKTTFQDATPKELLYLICILANFLRRGLEVHKWRQPANEPLWLACCPACRRRAGWGSLRRARGGCVATRARWRSSRGRRPSPAESAAGRGAPGGFSGRKYIGQICRNWNLLGPAAMPKGQRL